MTVSAPPEQQLDPRVVRTRRLLEQAFADVLREKGFQAATVQDITSRAGVNRATFYAHFADKYALLDHTITQGFRAEIDRRMLNACHYTPENLHALIVAVCEFIRSSRSRCKTPQPQFESLVETQVKAALHELLLKWLEQVDTVVPPQTAATAGSWAIYGLAAQWGRGSRSKSADEFATEVLPVAAANFGLAQVA
ncbi:MAG: TetR/AcrR family transcriptional regulator [Anaerolineales bacterium]|jgi:AcrR family transcriptional regulator